MTPAHFKGVAKFRFIFGIWLIWGLKLTIWNWNIGVFEKMAFKTESETVTHPPPPPSISYPKKTPKIGVTIRLFEGRKYGPLRPPKKGACRCPIGTC